MDLLLTGATVTAAAEGMGVTRQTVSGWLHEDRGFQAALNQRRRELRDGLSDRLRALLPRALDVLEQEIVGDGETKLPAAVHVLKACGLYGTALPIGPTDPRDVEADEQRRESDRLAAGVAREMWAKQ